jgi:serine/threonine-protein kinase
VPVLQQAAQAQQNGKFFLNLSRRLTDPNNRPSSSRFRFRDPDPSGVVHLMAFDSRSISEPLRAGVAGRVVPVVGNWRLVQLLGQSKWATVYRARPSAAGPSCPADYVVKLARPDGSAGPTAAQLIRREALVGSLVSHHHLCCVLSSRVHRPPWYLVMPYYEGQSIQQILTASRSIGSSRAVWIVRQAAEALTALHHAGWIHSDIKPANVFVSPNNHTTVLDLGLARRIEGEECQGRGPLAGTLAYAPPESFSSLVDLGPASDIYSLGVMLYQMLCGALPFDEQEPGKLAAAHVHCHPPDPRNRNPQLSADLVQLLRCMMDKQPSRRPVLEDLTQWLDSLQDEAWESLMAA